MKTFFPYAFIALSMFLLNCKKSLENTVVTHINCDGLVTDTLGTGDTARLYIQNAFTPNNDGLNDVSRIIAKSISSAVVTIYDGNNNVAFTTSQLSTADSHGFVSSSGWSPAATSSTEIYYYKVQAVTNSNHYIGVCGELYKLVCFPSGISRSNLYFEDQLMTNGAYSSGTIENLPDCH